MASQNDLQTFHNNWNSTAAWAQSKGIKYNDYYPIYQQDTQRVLQYGVSGAMSTAERERAIQAAANPSQAFQSTPSTAPNPSNVIGNTITDARNIFTGLGDVVIHPLHNGIVDSVKNTFDLIDGSHKLTGNTLGDKLGSLLTGTVLQFIPGMADIGTILQSGNFEAGMKALAEHPLGSILDLSGAFQPVRLAGLLGEGSSEALAGRAGLGGYSVAKHAGIVRVTKGLVMNTKTEKVGWKTGGGLGEMTIGDRFHAYTGGSAVNLNPDIAEAMAGGQMTVNHYNNLRLSGFIEWDKATEHFEPHQWQQLHDIMYKAERSSLNDAMVGVEDPRIIQAVDAYVDVKHSVDEMILSAKDGPLIITNPRTGLQNVFSLTGHPKVFKFRDAAMADEKALRESPELAHMDTLSQATNAAAQMAQQSIASTEQALQLARQVQVEGNIDPVTLTGAKRPTPFEKKRIATQGEDSLFGNGGDVARLLEKAKAGEWETVDKLSTATLKRLDKWSTTSVNAEDDVSWQSLRGEIDKLGKTAKAVVEIRKQTSKEVHGTAERWVGDKPHRDQIHKDQESDLYGVQKIQRQKLIAKQSETTNTLHRAYVLKRKHIREAHAHAQLARTAQLQEIKDRYLNEAGKAQVQNELERATFDEWKKGRKAQGLPAPRGILESAQEGVRIAPGAAGSPEHLLAAKTSLKLAEAKEMAAVPSEAELRSHFQAQISTATKRETMMVKDLEDQQGKDLQQLSQTHAGQHKDLKANNWGKKSREGKLSKLVKNYLDSQKKFEEAVKNHPSDNYEPIWFDLFAKNLIEDERMKASVNNKYKALSEKYGFNDEHIDRLHGDQKTMATLVELGIHGAFDDPIFDDLDQAIIRGAKDSAYEQLDEMAKAGLNPMWIHHASSTAHTNGISLFVGKGTHRPDVMNGRTWGMANSRFDVMASITHPMKQMLDRAAIKDYVTKYLDPRVVTEDDVMNTVLSYYQDEVSKLGLDRQGLLDFATEKMKDWGIKEFDPNAMFGFRSPRWGKGKVYLPEDLTKAVDKLMGDGSLPTSGIIDKGTRLFRYSILGLSPRYTAHITFGGTMLLALREPLFFVHIPEMLENMRLGRDPEDLQTSATQLGTTDFEIRTKRDAIRAHNHAAGTQTAHLLGQEHIEVKQGLKWKEASPIHWMKALADVNMHFTTTVVHMQRSLAFLAGKHRALGAEGMTEERAIYEGMQNATKVMGDLRRMSPFERDVARTVMPFYGWQKHILQYVLSYPADHPWRTVMLSQMAEYDTAHTPGGLPSRYQFLFFLGAPDAQGNVTATDLRAMNPLRDVANYATWGGLISGLNPVFSASLAAIDPQIIYGGNVLYPNLTYDQFYGIKEAGPQGNLLTAAAQIVPQVGALQSAMSLASQRKGMSDAQLIKSIGNQLNFPWVPQHLNLKQEAAKTAIAQYQVTKQLAANAWTTGDFSSIQDLGSVPDPRNPDYETPVSDLQSLYNDLAKAYPGQNPADTATPLPAVHI